MKDRLESLLRSHGLCLALVAAVAICFFSPTLYAPWSLIDDGRLTEQAAKVGQRWQGEGVGAAIHEVIKPEHNFMGPAMRLEVLLQYHLFGGCRMAWHGAKLLQLVLLCWGLYFLGRLTGCGRWSACAGACLFVVFDPPSTHGHFQSLIINYARLFTTDSYFMVWSVWSAVMFLHTLRCSGVREGRWSAGLFFFFFLNAALTKLTFLANACAYPIVLAAWFAPCWREGVFRRKGLVVAGFFCAATVAGLLFFRPWVQTKVAGYEESQLVTSLPALWQSALVYIGWMLEVVSFLAPVACLGLFCAGVVAIVGLVRGGGLSPGSVALLLVSLLFSGDFVFQCLWPIILPRYMVVYTPFLCVLLARGIDGAVAPFAGQLAGLPWGRRWVAVLSLTVAGAACWCWSLRNYYHYSPPYPGRQIQVVLRVSLLAAAGVMASGLALFVRGWRWRGWLHAPGFALIAGHGLFMGVILWLHAEGSIGCYLARERQLAIVWEESDRLSASLGAGETGKLYLNITGEELGSIPLVNRYLRGLTNVEVAPIEASTREFEVTARTRFVTFANVNAQLYGPETLFYLGAPLATAPGFEGPGPGRALGVGEAVETAMRLEKPFNLSIIQLDPDPLGWHRDLDLSIELKIGDRSFSEIARIDAVEVPRGRLGEVAAFLPSEVPLPAGVPIVFRLVPRAHGVLEAGRLEKAAVNFTMYSKFGGVALPSPSPRLQLRGSVPGAPRLRLLRQRTEEANERVFLSPLGLLWGAAGGNYWHEAQLPTANRSYRFRLIAEVSGMPP